MIYLAQRHLESTETSELDFQLYEDFGLQDEAFDTAGVIQLGEGKASGEPMLIDALVQKLNELKKAGCNYVGLESHGDHHGYIFSGYHIYSATRAEVVAFEQRQRKALIRDQAIKALYQRIRELSEKPL